MPLTKEQRAEYDKEYRKKNKEKIAKEQKEYRLNHKEKSAEYAKEYRLNNKEKIKKYPKTPNSKKTKVIYKWKQRGIKSDNYDMLYNNYLSETHCDLCRVEFGKRGDGTGTFKCCDHNHETGLFRNFLCCKCNLKRR